MNYSMMKVNEEKAREVIAQIPDNVRMLVASKYIDVDGIKELEKLGVNLFGENVVQAFMDKQANYTGNSEFHFIGTLQTNKVKYIIDKVTLIHSVANTRLIDKIDAEALKVGKVQDVLLQVNIAKEDSKHGFDESEMRDALKYALSKENLRPVGLMMMAPNEDPEETRIHFRNTKALQESLKKEFGLDYFNELSMGMSNDYQIAIEEGSTIVRIGRLIFNEE